MIKERFCTKCANDILKKPRPRCPDHEEELRSDQLFKDRCAAREIQALECYCGRKKDGCTWKGMLADLQKHACPFEKVECVNKNKGCKAIILRCQLPSHIDKKCLYREVQCQFCLREVLEIHLDKHHEKCSKFLIECENNCGVNSLPRDQMEEHINLHCPLKIRYCRYFHHLGCEFQGTEEQIKEHDKDFYNKHLELSGQHAERTEHELQTLKKKIAILEEKNRQFENHVKEQNEVISSVRETLSTQQVKLMKVEEFIVNQNKTVEELMKKGGKTTDEPELPLAVLKMVDDLREQLEGHSKKMKSLENESAVKAYTLQEKKDFSLSSGLSVPGSLEQRIGAGESSVAWHDVRLAEHELRLSILDQCSYDGTFVWKIENYSRRFQEAIVNKTPSLYSPPFYTSRFGYKMCARVYLNGDGSGKGTHVSVFISVMRGEYDAVLPWPFSKKITLKLLDQNHLEDITETFRPDRNSSSFMRPRADMNIASGCPKFCTHLRLQTNGYVKENTMFIKVIVN
ncbi:TNF receptor-associated factor 3-like isoform X2 [Actinia tenebrosa]|uniref:TNF receptor-associated factor 3-like isoform X2 n=1 Tax=Actinia tenebrosa TaxID=6105 RepID=A0A6P8IPQ6_ACTTE|nr:TNF receptor-associated factor 3-like isoform X2 [Actinia tenebrosa]